MRKPRELPFGVERDMWVDVGGGVLATAHYIPPSPFNVDGKFSLQVWSFDRKTYAADVTNTFAGWQELPVNERVPAPTNYREAEFVLA